MRWCGRRSGGCWKILGWLQAELDRSLHSAQTTDPGSGAEDALRRDPTRLTTYAVTVADRVPGGPDHVRRAPLPHAGTAQAAAGKRSGNW